MIRTAEPYKHLCGADTPVVRIGLAHAARLVEQYDRIKRHRCGYRRKYQQTTCDCHAVKHSIAFE
jgi:hypothetical protein